MKCAIRRERQNRCLVFVFDMLGVEYTSSTFHRLLGNDMHEQTQIPHAKTTAPQRCCSDDITLILQQGPGR
jgi:hypothetical protein